MLLCIERSLLRWHLIRMPPKSLFGGFVGTSNWEETPGSTHNSVEGLFISSGLGMPQDELVKETPDKWKKIGIMDEL